jgi:hypothetical protein
MKYRHTIFFLLCAACAAEVPGIAGSPADPKAKTAPIQTGVGVLASSFDSERLAPSGSTASNDEHAHHNHGQQAPAATEYTCSHHPEVISDKPGQCPKCGMDLVPKKPAAAPSAPKTDPHEGHK